jgi:hypothetical protein
MSTVIAYLQRDGGWGPSIKVTIADTVEADAAAADFFRRRSTVATRHAAHLAYDESTAPAGSQMLNVFDPICEHGLSGNLCAGPGHYPMDM